MSSGVLFFCYMITFMLRSLRWRAFHLYICISVYFLFMESIEVAGIGEIKVRRSTNIKFLSIRMAPGRGIWVNVPFGVSKRLVENFLEEKREWILQNRAKMNIYEKDTGVGLKIGAEIQTKLHILKIAETDQIKPSYKIEDKMITLFIPQGAVFARVEKIVQQFLLEIYKLECSQYLPGRVKLLAEKYGFRYERLSFRNNTSNWGSCSGDDNISLNIKLMKLPDEIVDYVILHELCHTVEKNHSVSFWKLVRKVCPDYADLRNKLRKYNTRV